MIQLLVPADRQGGVYHFASGLRDQLGHERAQLVMLSEQNRQAWSIQAHDMVVLQMSGYGYDRRGAPRWLVDEITDRRRDMARLGIFFHELYAFGPPWRSSFWLSPAQRRICGRLAGLADFWMTSREDSARWLMRHAPHRPHSVLPVFSVVGEPGTFDAGRASTALVFGSPAVRAATYQAAGDRLFQWARREQVQVHDIGSPLEDKHLAARLDASGVVLHGYLGLQELRAIMCEARYGLVAYPASYLAKSSVFASYCAHGLCPVVLSREFGRADGLEPDRHYLPGLPNDKPAAVPAVARQAYDWYQHHRLSIHVETLLQQLAIS